MSISIDPAGSTGSTDPIFITENLINQPATEARAASAPGIVCAFVDENKQGCTEVYPISSTEEDYESRVIEFVSFQLEKQSDRKLTCDNFYRQENPVFDYIYEARSTLLSEILPTNRKNPPNKYKLDVIGKIGNALDQQLGKDIGKSSIPGCLEQLFTRNNPWYQYYTDHLHKYTKPVKHRDKQEHFTYAGELSSAEGRLITARYFEAVRKFFVWHLGDEGGASHSFLEQIDYTQYGLNVTIPDP